MDDAGRVRRREARADLLGDRLEPRPRHRRRADLARQRLAVDELHRQELLALVLADVEHARDVAVLDPARQLHLAAKPLERVVGQPGAQHLERDALVELGVERLVDAAHAAAAEPAHDAIATGDELGVLADGRRSPSMQSAASWRACRRLRRQASAFSTHTSGMRGAAAGVVGNKRGQLDDDLGRLFCR